MLESYKAIIFDWDGTLVDSTDWVLSAHNHVRENMNMPLWTMDDIFGCSSMSTRELYPKLYEDRAEEAMALLSGYVEKYNLEGANPYNESFNLLTFLNKLNIPAGVVSNKRHEPLNEMIDYLEWRHFFSSIIGAGYAERDKPHPSSLLMAMSQIEQSLKPQDILYVGDTETDLLTAQNTGCDVVFIQSDKPRPDLIAKYAPKHAFDDLGAFYDAVTQRARVANVV